MAPRYGPDEHFQNNVNNENENESNTQKEDLLSQQTNEFQQLVNDVLQVSDPQHIPSLLTKRMPLLLTLINNNNNNNDDNNNSKQKAVQIVQNTLDHYKDDPPQQQEIVSQTIDMILSFVEEFCQQAEQLDRQNKELLGKILRVMSDNNNTNDNRNNTSNNRSSRQRREDNLNQLLQNESLTPGFLRHLQGECERIANAPKITKESARLLETLHVLQTRVLEELGGQELGEAAQVLGQLIGYESTAERVAVLEAGLAVRGVEFAEEMLGLTDEALDGFTTRPNVEPGLVKCVQEIDERLRRFVQEHQEEASFQ